MYVLFIYVPVICRCLNTSIEMMRNAFIYNNNLLCIKYFTKKQNSFIYFSVFYYATILHVREKGVAIATN